MNKRVFSVVYLHISGLKSDITQYGWPVLITNSHSDFLYIIYNFIFSCHVAKVALQMPSDILLLVGDCGTADFNDEQLDNSST